MAKKKTIKKSQDLKITDEELKELQAVVSGMNQTQLQIGQLEVQKSKLIHAISDLDARLALNQKTLEEKYGNKTVNIHDGTLKDTADGSLDKKN
tara:strand:- start:131 stop:412 length:282 start_codon:yes stop_codon:yes gene_type:complete